MANSQTCQYCCWWSFTYKDGRSDFGTCENVFVPERVRVSQDFNAAENDEPVIFTESTFGCVYFEQDGDKAVTKIELPGNE